jgi:hypothetical protein
MRCPGCNQEVEAFFTVPSNDLEPFTSVDAFKGLKAWGGYGVQRTILCQVGAYTHFKFDRTGTDHLVKIEKFDLAALTAAHDYHNEHPRACQHIENEMTCLDAGIPCYFDWSNETPDAWYCADHAHTNGFCPSCGLFNAGFEAFDFSPTGLCESCQEYLAIEFDEDDDVYEDDYEED